MSLLDVCCITPNCKRFVAQSLGRGLCMLCYSKAKKLVAGKTTTWKQLEEMGLALPDASDPFTQAFNEAKDKHASDN